MSHNTLNIDKTGGGLFKKIRSYLASDYNGIIVLNNVNVKIPMGFFEILIANNNITNKDTELKNRINDLLTIDGTPPKYILDNRITSEDSTNVTYKSLFQKESKVKDTNDAKSAATNSSADSMDRSHKFHYAKINILKEGYDMTNVVKITNSVIKKIILKMQDTADNGSQTYPYIGLYLLYVIINISLHKKVIDVIIKEKEDKNKADQFQVHSNNATLIYKCITKFSNLNKIIPFFIKNHIKETSDNQLISILDEVISLIGILKYDIDNIDYLSFKNDKSGLLSALKKLDLYFLSNFLLLNCFPFLFYSAYTCPMYFEYTDIFLNFKFLLGFRTIKELLHYILLLPKYYYNQDNLKFITCCFGTKNKDNKDIIENLDNYVRGYTLVYIDIMNKLLNNYINLPFTSLLCGNKELKPFNKYYDSIVSSSHLYSCFDIVEYVESNSNKSPDNNMLSTYNKDANENATKTTNDISESFISKLQNSKSKLTMEENNEANNFPFNAFRVTNNLSLKLLTVILCFVFDMSSSFCNELLEIIYNNDNESSSVLINKIIEFLCDKNNKKYIISEENYPQFILIFSFLLYNVKYKDNIFNSTTQPPSILNDEYDEGVVKGIAESGMPYLVGYIYNLLLNNLKDKQGKKINFINICLYLNFLVPQCSYIENFVIPNLNDTKYIIKTFFINILRYLFYTFVGNCIINKEKNPNTNEYCINMLYNLIPNKVKDNILNTLAVRTDNFFTFNTISVANGEFNLLFINLSKDGYVNNTNIDVAKDNELLINLNSIKNDPDNATFLNELEYYFSFSTNTADTSGLFKKIFSWIGGKFTQVLKMTDLKKNLAGQDPDKFTRMVGIVNYLIYFLIHTPNIQLRDDQPIQIKKTPIYFLNYKKNKNLSNSSEPKITPITKLDITFLYNKDNFIHGSGFKFIYLHTKNNIDYYIRYVVITNLFEIPTLSSKDHKSFGIFSPKVVQLSGLSPDTRMDESCIFLPLPSDKTKFNEIQIVSDIYTVLDSNYDDIKKKKLDNTKIINSYLNNSYSPESDLLNTIVGIYNRDNKDPLNINLSFTKVDVSELVTFSGGSYSNGTDNRGSYFGGSLATQSYNDLEIDKSDIIDYIYQNPFIYGQLEIPYYWECKCLSYYLNNIKDPTKINNSVILDFLSKILFDINLLHSFKKSLFGLDLLQITSYLKNYLEYVEKFKIVISNNYNNQSTNNKVSKITNQLLYYQNNPSNIDNTTYESAVNFFKFLDNLNFQALQSIIENNITYTVPIIDNLKSDKLYKSIIRSNNKDPTLERLYIKIKSSDSISSFVNVFSILKYLTINDDQSDYNQKILLQLLTILFSNLSKTNKLIFYSILKNYNDYNKVSLKFATSLFVKNPNLNIHFILDTLIVPIKLLYIWVIFNLKLLQTPNFKIDKSDLSKLIDNLKRLDINNDIYAPYQYLGCINSHYTEFVINTSFGWYNDETLKLESCTVEQKILIYKFIRYCQKYNAIYGNNNIEIPSIITQLLNIIPVKNYNEKELQKEDNDESIINYDKDINNQDFETKNKIKLQIKIIRFLESVYNYYNALLNYNQTKKAFQLIFPKIINIKIQHEYYNLSFVPLINNDLSVLNISNNLIFTKQLNYILKQTNIAEKNLIKFIEVYSINDLVQSNYPNYELLINSTISVKNEEFTIASIDKIMKNIINYKPSYLDKQFLELINYKESSDLKSGGFKKYSPGGGASQSTNFSNKSTKNQKLRPSSYQNRGNASRGIIKTIISDENIINIINEQKNNYELRKFISEEKVDNISIEFTSLFQLIFSRELNFIESSDKENHILYNLSCIGDNLFKDPNVSNFPIYHFSIYNLLGCCPNYKNLDNNNLFLLKFLPEDKNLDNRYYRLIILKNEICTVFSSWSLKLKYSQLFYNLTSLSIADNLQFGITPINLLLFDTENSEFVPDYSTTKTINMLLGIDTNQVVNSNLNLNDKLPISFVIFIEDTNYTNPYNNPNSGGTVTNDNDYQTITLTTYSTEKENKFNILLIKLKRNTKSNNSVDIDHIKKILNYLNYDIKDLISISKKFLTKLVKFTTYLTSEDLQLKNKSNSYLFKKGTLFDSFHNFKSKDTIELYEIIRNLEFLICSLLFMYVICCVSTPHTLDSLCETKTASFNNLSKLDIQSLNLFWYNVFSNLNCNDQLLSITNNESLIIKPYYTEDNYNYNNFSKNIHTFYIMHLIYKNYSKSIEIYIKIVLLLGNFNNNYNFNPDYIIKCFNFIYLYLYATLYVFQVKNLIVNSNNDYKSEWICVEDLYASDSKFLDDNMFLLGGKNTKEFPSNSDVNDIILIIINFVNDHQYTFLNYIPFSSYTNKLSHIQDRNYTSKLKENSNKSVHLNSILEMLYKLSKLSNYNEYIRNKQFSGLDIPNIYTLVDTSTVDDILNNAVLNDLNLGYDNLNGTSGSINNPFNLLVLMPFLMSIRPFIQDIFPTHNSIRLEINNKFKLEADLNKIKSTITIQLNLFYILKNSNDEEVVFICDSIQADIFSKIDNEINNYGYYILNMKNYDSGLFLL